MRVQTHQMKCQALQHNPKPSMLIASLQCFWHRFITSYYSTVWKKRLSCVHSFYSFQCVHFELMKFHQKPHTTWYLHFVGHNLGDAHPIRRKKPADGYPQAQGLLNDKILSLCDFCRNALDCSAYGHLKIGMSS